MIEYENLKAVNEAFFNQFEEEAIKVIRGGWYILGESVDNFEKEFAAWNGNRFCIGTANGLDALVLSLDALNLPKGSEIIVPANTYIATIIAIIRTGHRPVLVEPDPGTLNIDVNRIAAKITSNTKAIQVVHMYGRICDMSAIMKIAEDFGLFVLEDCAQSHGASFNGKKCGTFGILNSFSFYPTKNLGALGDAGAIVTDNQDFAEKIRELRNYGSKRKYHNDTIGYNSRLDEIQAAFLRIKLAKLDSINFKKRELASIYRRELRNANISISKYCSDQENVYHIFPVFCKDRDDLRKYLLNLGIKTEVHYPIAPHNQVAMKHAAALGLWEPELSGYPVSEQIHLQEISLPISYATSAQEVQSVADALNSYRQFK
ncbi:DegT/DnrJ/EryC1/StrS aminotransferase family protein [Leptospira fainei serovar Hurstbridge str. BUT 6]|uniref:DegT/DnrJ/EryC1/StrS aminotransferase family protein n=1 Tax=Leptospira fainei serovar Hurstbridge str. BUT 6 TaxID=1193011 RepID=S3VHZ7_9LEPT|nr:DegT/DnrJ/EryC1/StrS family aminotransferase [Leptospira fainei]EPG76070.1 DegT/DnrJ/EryC1/StrS aminotransferase family protein [Leptospira fainei serovar Hurstbridge str. BUT 6]